MLTRQTTFSNRLGLKVALLFVIAAWHGAPASAQDAAKNKKILLLFTHQADQPAQVIVEQAIRSKLQSGLSVPVEFYSEYLDAVRLPLDIYEKDLIVQLQRKYGGKNFDLVFAVNPPALKLAVKNRAALFPDTPIVYLVLDRKNLDEVEPGSNMAKLGITKPKTNGKPQTT